MPMSSRWKLLRFLKAEPILNVEHTDVSSDANGISLFPAIGGAIDHKQHDESHILALRQFSTTAGRATSSHSAEGIYAFALPRGVVEVYVFKDGSLLSGEILQSRALPMHLTFTAHESVISALQVIPGRGKDSPGLVTVGSDAKFSSVKIWTFAEGLALPEASRSPCGQDLVAKEGQSNQRMSCTATLRFSSDEKPSAVAVSSNFKLKSSSCAIAVGCVDGAVLVFRGEFHRDKFTRVRIAPAAGEMEQVRPVLYIAYCGFSLFCVTEQSVALIYPQHTTEVPHAINKYDFIAEMPRSHTLHIAQDLDISSINYVREVLDSRGAADAAAVTFVPAMHEIALAREEALYFFNTDGKGQCLAFPSKKHDTCLGAFGTYVVHATRPGTVVVYDVATKIIAFKESGDVRTIFTNEEKRSAILCKADGTIFRLAEVPLHDRVDLLMTRGLHASAIALAKSDTSGPDAIPSALYTHAVQRYAEFLMQKGDYGSAAKQLVTTIGGSVDPSWVITRLVEQPGLRSGLRSYLEALHHAGQTSFVYTRVLIACYKHDRARSAILRLQTNSTAEDKTSDSHIVKVLSDVNWSVSEVDAAVRICCESGLHGVAESVARKRGRYVSLASTLVFHLEDVDGGLRILRSVDNRGDALSIASICGRKFIAAAPLEFVAVILEMCNKGFINAQSTNLVVAKNGSHDIDNVSGNLIPILGLFVDQPRWLGNMLEGLMHRQQLSFDSGSGSQIDSSKLAPEIWLQLFETLARVDVDGKGSTVGRRALKLLQSRIAKVDQGTALRIAERYGHAPCMEYLYENSRMYRELATHLRLNGDVNGILRASRRHGKREPYLWLESLRLIAPLAGLRAEKDRISGTKLDDNVVETESDDVRLEDTNLDQVLLETVNALDSSGYLSPIEIIDVMSQSCRTCSWHLVQPFFEKTIANLTSRAEAEESASFGLSCEAQGVQSEISRLDEPVIVQPRLCSACDDALTLPITYFYCNHIFHVTCLSSPQSPSMHLQRPDFQNGDIRNQARYSSALRSEPCADIQSSLWTEVECPRCAPELDAMVSMRNALEEKNERHDDFFRLLRGSKRDQGFDTVIGYMSRCPFL